MAYADDLAFLARSPSGLQCLLDCLVIRGAEAGLVVNAAKTKAMLWGDFPEPMPLKIGEAVIEYVDKFIYLGGAIQSVDADISRRIQQANHAVFRMKAAWECELDAKVVGTLFQSSIQSVFFYGVETWTLTDARLKRIVGAYTFLLRRVLRQSWEVGLNDLLLMSGLKHPVEVIYRRQLTALGHQLRACAREQASMSRAPDSATLVLRPLGHVLQWRGTAETKYTNRGRKAVKRKQRVGQGNRLTFLRSVLRIVRQETLQAAVSGAGGRQVRQADHPLNREKRGGHDPTERLATARTAVVLHPLNSDTDQAAYAWLHGEAQKRATWQTLVDRVAKGAALRY